VQLEAAFLLGAALAVCWKSVFGWRLHALHGSSECACMLMLQGFGGWPAAGFWTAYVARGEDPIRMRVHAHAAWEQTPISWRMRGPVRACHHALVLVMHGFPE
jgi:hypothetical protein